MVIDHVGKVFYAGNLYWQMIGRICFPLFCYCLVVGFLHTRNQWLYLKRLLIFAIASQPLYIWVFEYDLVNLNIFVTLAVALFSMILLEKRRWLLYFIVLMSSVLIPIDYGILGILLVNTIYIFRDKPTVAILILSMLFLSQLFVDLNAILFTLLTTFKLEIVPSPSINFLGMVSLLLIYPKIGFDLKLKKSFFYVFYPGHLFVLLLAKHMVSLLWE